VNLLLWPLNNGPLEFLQRIYLIRLSFRGCGYFCIALGIVVCPWWTFGDQARYWVGPIPWTFIKPHIECPCLILSNVCIPWLLVLPMDLHHVQLRFLLPQWIRHVHGGYRCHPHGGLLGHSKVRIISGFPLS